MSGWHDTMVCTAAVDSIALARHWVRDAVATDRGLDGELVDDLALLTSELVTLSLRDGAGEQLRVRVADDGYAIRVDVTDEHPETVERLRAPSEEAVARALDVVHALSDDWGWRTDGRGHKIVWAMVVVPEV